MKKLTLLFTVFFAALFSNAQNVAINNDGTSATASAMLDVKSTTKGFMMPRMTTAQRTTIASPALGLLVFDTDTKTIWAYDGSSWKNLYTSGGGLILPFSQSVNTATSAFQINNDGPGAAIEGSSSAQFGIGMTAKTTGEGSWGLYAFSNGAGSQSIRSYADNGTAFHGENNNAANTNTLMNLLNKGAGKTGSFQLTNSSSASPNVQIAGNHLGHQLKIYQTNASNTQAAVSIENSGTGASISATSTTGEGVTATSTTNYAIKGVTNTATGFAGVIGQNNGTAGSGVIGRSDAANTQGVYGVSENGTAVRAITTSGTALKGNSTSGYALDISGNVKIAGGNTNPGAGAVLTSDANGNATWQSNRIAFKAFEINSAFQSIGNSGWEKVYFSNEQWDLGNDFAITPNGTSDPNSSVFTVDKSGIYHLDANLSMAIPNVTEATADIRIRLIHGGVTSTLQINTAIIGYTIDYFDFKNAMLKASGDFLLVSGDKVYIEVAQYSGNDINGMLFSSSEYYFSSHLVIPL